MAAELRESDFQVRPDDVAVIKDAFLFIGAKVAEKSGRAGAARAWNHLERRGMADLLIDAGMTEHPLWNRFGGKMPERSPLQFYWVSQKEVTDEWWNEGQPAGLVLRSLRPYAAKVRDIIEAYDNLDERRMHVGRYAGGVVGAKVVDFWENVCDTLLPEENNQDLTIVSNRLCLE